MDESFINEFKEVTVLKPKDLTNSVPLGKEVKKELCQYWDRDFVNQTINSIENPEHRILMQFMWYTGIRISEVINLTKGDIDFKNYTMTIRWLKSKKYKYRIVPIRPEIKQLLELYTAYKNTVDRVFPISRQRAWQIYQKYFDGHPHQMRHSFAVNWLRSGNDVITLHRILGHSKVQTTMEYLKIVPLDQGKELMKVQFN
jgi:integrase/recombinase XerD